MSNARSTFKPENFGRRLAQIRKARGLTQEELATQVGMTQRILTYYETRSKNPPVGHVLALAKALNVSVEDLTGTESAKDPVALPSTNSRVWKAFQDFLKLSAEDQRSLARQMRGILAQSH